MSERILIVAPPWVGDAILSEPLVAVLREPLEEPGVDVLAPPWCAPIYQRMRGIRNVIENPVGHRELGLAKRRALAETLRQHAYTRAFILPNSFKSALIPWLARIPRRTGYVGEARGMLLTDVRRLDRKAPKVDEGTVSKACRSGDRGARAAFATPAPAVRRAAPPVPAARSSDPHRARQRCAAGR